MVKRKLVATGFIGWGGGTWCYYEESKVQEPVKNICVHALLEQLRYYSRPACLLTVIYEVEVKCNAVTIAMG